ncbi:hypothetical protein [Rhizobium leguminosarum]|uniref:hypothetical protein n=1 Tax=Rhizobium leguminosarum TaxID=384 RepID=UPI001C97ED99|nr:hypothetical protein [Rhizobium leguminosarum]MBY5404683.1 hypothetical protein [Rhizobium leguminosarum]
MTVHWGLLAKENVQPSRRRLTLDLGRAVTLYNEAAAPGLGGVWFIRQAALALLGIRLATEVPDAGSKIVVSNAIEALACWIGYEDQRWERGDWRLRGPRKLRVLQETGKDKKFQVLTGASAYVTQPMRMGCVEALRGLGLADAVGARYNSFSVNARGRLLIDAVFGIGGPGQKNLPKYLRDWVNGSDVNFTRSLRSRLNPTSDAGEDARKVMREALSFAGDVGSGPQSPAARRRNAMAWMRRIDAEDFGANPHTDWGDRPPEIAEDHWQDMRAGAALLQTRNVAVDVVAQIEQHLIRRPRIDLARPLPEKILGALDIWREHARSFRALDSHGPREAASAAEAFCAEALQSDAAAIAMLVKRENHMLRVTGGAVLPTAAWRSDAALAIQDLDAIEDETEDTIDGAPKRGERDLLPPYISVRMIHLRRLTLDVDGRLDTYIQEQRQP